MVCETLQNVLAKFQPLCHKIVAAEAQGEEDQDKISAMIAMVWDEMPKLISKQELMDMDSGGSTGSSPYGKGKGKGAGKGAGKGGKGRGRGGAARGNRVEDMLNRDDEDPNGEGRDRRQLFWQFSAQGRCGYGKDCRFRHEHTEAEGTAARRAASASGDEQEEELELLRKFYIQHTTPEGGNNNEVAVARRLSV